MRRPRQAESSVGNWLLSSRALTAVTMIAALAVAGCSGTTRSGKTLSLEACGQRAYNRASSDQPIKALSADIKQAQENITVLQKRASLTKGQINLSRFANATEVSADSDSLTLRFERSTFWDTQRVDTVRFDIQNGEPVVSPGAIACTAASELRLNGTFSTLELYVEQTQALDQALSIQEP